MARIRQRLPNPDGWSSKGERIRDRFGNPVGLGLIQGEGDLMASKNEVARGADVPLVLAAQGQTRDALVDPQPGDYIGDPEKGNHVGEVRQPAEPVLTKSGDVHFESIADSPSKFTSTYADDFAKLDERLQGDPEYAGTLHVPIVGDPDEADRIYAERRKAAGRSRSSGGSRSSGRSTDTGSGAADTLDSDSADVARAQAADDKS